ncbi:hypothetical protein HGRIS_002206 [Hohenbuehelia grisea]|uniref:Uncharacterized protein n=1 Tax=Hohenbuehelia grisea TaxID=104357 RepID=A0ABR3JL68_9AGAR
MGVGAIFVSTLALTRLPEPQTPANDQKELLAAVLHPIVSFVVLGSIILHGLSIPFFSFGRNVSRSVSLSATLTSRSRNDVPDWVSWVRTAPVQNPAPPSSRPDEEMNRATEEDIEAAVNENTALPARTPNTHDVQETSDKQFDSVHVAHDVRTDESGPAKAPEKTEGQPPIKAVHFPCTE